MPILKVNFSQQGSIPPLALVAIIIIIGGIYFTSQKPKAPQNTPGVVKTTQATPTPTPEWETYKDSKYNYTIKYPKNWAVENLPSQDSSSIRLADDQKTAFVLVDSIIGPSLEKTGEKEKVLDLLEGKLKTNTHLKINSFTRSNETDIGGYLATGEETYDNKTVLFEERFIVSKNGRGLRMHSIYASDSAKINRPVTQEIMGSYKTFK